MKLVRNLDIDKEKWYDLLEKSQYSSTFQSLEFYNLYNSTDNLSSDAFAVEEDGEYKSLIVVTIQKEKGLKGFFSKRGVVYGGPLFIGSQNVFLEFLLENVRQHYKRKLIYLEVRNNFDFSSSLEVFEKAGWKYEQHLNVQLNVENTNVEDILSAMKYNRRREVRLSYKEGAVTRPAKDEKEVSLLYDILKDMYLKRVKLPINPISFFLNLYNSSIGKVFVVIHNDKIIGGSFCLYYKNMAINTLYYTGLRGYHKKIFPTHIAIMGIIEFAIENNLKMVDFMGAGKPNVKYGVRDYKLQFGGDLVEHGRFNIIFKPRLYKLGILGLQVLAKIK
jgi:lipid II:glycine glycyltransferase (peptidoglycan interpeptide bridge formation enzyme)